MIDSREYRADIRRQDIVKLLIMKYLKTAFYGLCYPRGALSVQTSFYNKNKDNENKLG